MKVDSVYMTDKRRTEIRSTELGSPGRGEVQVEVVACGVCAWDSYLFRGRDLTEKYPFPFGHEAVGIVRAIGEASGNFSVGDKVFCINGGPSMAQAINIRSEFVGLLPGDPVSADDFSVLIGEPPVCVVNGMANTPVKPGAEVAVIGCGYMGLLNTQAYSRSLIGRLTCFDRHANKLALAREFGADACVDLSADPGGAATAEPAATGGFDIVVECTGSQAGLALATELCAPGGVISNFAWHREARSIDASPWHLKGLRVINTAPACDPHFSDHVQQTQRLMARGVFDQHKLITHRAEYRDVQDILELSSSHAEGYIKGVVMFW
jgi:threonine dehydrogenase-like Zn-dependent dehydrogenase